MANIVGWLNRIRASFSPGGGRRGMSSARLRLRIDHEPRVEFLEARRVMSYTVLNLGAFSSDGAIPVVNGLNNRGAVIGTSAVTSTGQYYRGFVYRHGKLSNVGTMGGNSQSVGINDQGTIVGLTMLFPKSATRRSRWCSFGVVAGFRSSRRLIRPV